MMAPVRQEHHWAWMTCWNEVIVNKILYMILSVDKLAEWTLDMKYIIQINLNVKNKN